MPNPLPSLFHPPPIPDNKTARVCSYSHQSFFAGQRQPSPGNLNLSSNNPFRNRLSTASQSPASATATQPDYAFPTMSNNPFLDPSESAVKSQGKPSVPDDIFVSDYPYILVRNRVSMTQDMHANISEWTCRNWCNDGVLHFFLLISTTTINFTSCHGDTLSRLRSNGAIHEVQ